MSLSVQVKLCKILSLIYFTARYVVPVVSSVQGCKLSGVSVAGVA